MKYCISYIDLFAIRSYIRMVDEPERIVGQVGYITTSEPVWATRFETNEVLDMYDYLCNEYYKIRWEIHTEDFMDIVGIMES